MKWIRELKAIFTAVAVAVILFSAALTSAQETNPAMEKFQQDLKAAVLNGSITGPQVKELKENIDVLKAAKGNQTAGAPVDLLTPYNAVSKIRAIVATIQPPDQQTLTQDFRMVMAAKKAAAPETAAEPETPGKKLGKDIFGAVMHGEPTAEQVQTLQDSLNSLQSLKGSSAGGLQKLRTLRKAKTDIEATMNAGSFRPQDKQAVLDDLNSLGGGGRG